MSRSVSSSFELSHVSLAAGVAFFLSLAAAGAAAGAAALPSVVTTIAGPAVVVDGDTIEVSGQRIRLEGIDAPESGQTCSDAAGRAWNCGTAAAQTLRRILSGKDVVSDSRGLDKYGRMLGICYEEGLEINAELVRRGLAWAFVKYSQTYVAIEAEARQAMAGIWQGPAMPAWEYRHGRWNVAEQTAPNGCAIKGNISGKGRIFHMPWSPWYPQVTVDPSRGERWFCSESEAIAAGWRPVAGS
jgi:endonuclease YncB( thermonuclease family)